LGFGDVIVLNDVICEAVNNGADLGSSLYLKQYQSNRQLHNLPVMACSSVGLNIFDSSSSVKSLITQRASVKLSDVVQIFFLCVFYRDINITIQITTQIKKQNKSSTRLIRGERHLKNRQT
jgi:hypothetical protein